MLAAEGALAPRAHEQVALLVLLADDPDEEIARNTRYRAKHTFIANALLPEDSGQGRIFSLRGCGVRGQFPRTCAEFRGPSLLSLPNGRSRQNQEDNAER